MNANRAATLQSIVGKYYIRDNITSDFSAYWMGESWTTNPHDAVIYDELHTAEWECVRINESDDKPAIVCRARFELPSIEALRAIGRVK